MTAADCVYGRGGSPASHTSSGASVSMMTTISSNGDTCTLPATSSPFSCTAAGPCGRPVNVWDNVAGSSAVNGRTSSLVTPCTTRACTVATSSTTAVTTNDVDRQCPGNAAPNAGCGAVKSTSSSTHSVRTLYTSSDASTHS